MKKTTKRNYPKVIKTPKGTAPIPSLTGVAPTFAYKATIKVLGTSYEAFGDTAKEAITNLKVQNLKGRSILVVEKGSVRKERILMPALAFRLFNTAGFSREVALKNVSILFE